MNKFKKLTATVVSLMMICTSMGGFAFGTSADRIDDVITCDKITITLSKTDKLSFSMDKVGKPTVTCNGYTVIYTDKIILEGTSENGFTVESGEHNIVLKGVTFNDSITIKPNAIANIKVEEKTENIITAKVDKGFDDIGKAGINVPEGATLNLSGNGTLTATGSDDGGSLWGDGGAGIGGNDEENAGKINITGGKIKATGGKDASGIGGGDDGTGGNITISGEETEVTATGGVDGAGIGGGNDGIGGNITISGGTVNATGKKYGAGIGGGNNGIGGNITISGEKTKVTAKGGKKGAGIGGGNFANSGNIKLSGGNITATGGFEGAGIGGGNDGIGGNITISGEETEVTATGGEKGAGIGGGFYRNGGNITISGGNITANGGENGAGIGGGADGNGGNITISGEETEVTAKGGEKGAGIGGGNGFADNGLNGLYNADGECENITIDRSAVIAIAGKDAEPIGGGADELYTGAVKINGNKLNKETRQKYKDWKKIIINTEGKVKKYTEEIEKNIEKCKYEDTKDIDVGNFKVIKQIDGKCYISYGDNNTGNECSQEQLSGGIDYTGVESPNGLMLKPGNYTVVLDLDKNYFGKEICIFNKKTVIRLHGVTEEEFLNNVYLKSNINAISELEFVEVQE